MKPLYFLALMLFSLNSFSQTKFEENLADSIDNKLDSILIIGAGSSVTRAFLENLSTYIIKGCKKSKVIAKFNYLGKDINYINKDFDSLKNDGYQAVLFLLPKNESTYKASASTIQQTTNTPAGYMTSTRTSYRLHYDQDFVFQLCLPLENMKRIWSASVEISCDPSRKDAAKNIAQKVLNSFKNYNYIQ